MKIQTIQPEIIINRQLNTTKESSNVFKSKNIYSDSVSFSGKHAKKPGILKTVAASLGILTVLTGCSTIKESKITDKPKVDKNDVSYSSSLSSDSCKSENNKIAMNFGLKLLDYGEDLSYSDVEKEISDFFDKNGITNVVIKDISTSPEISSSLIGAFVPSYQNAEYSGGKMYIDKPRNFSDEKERIKYAEEVSHELTHVLQFKNDDTNQGLKGIISGSDDMKVIFRAVNDFKQTTPVIYARNAALSDYVSNSMSESDYNYVLENINEYGLAFYDKKISIQSSDVKNAVTKSVSGNNESFEDTVNSLTDEYLNAFVNNYDIAADNQTKMKKAMLSNIIFNYKAEAEAYRTSTSVEEVALGIRGESLSDFIPETYDEIVKVLEKKLKNEY